MPVYLGDVPLDSAAVGATAADAIYLGSTKVWPPVTFPYVITDTNVTDADVPEGATGCWVTLHGKGANGTAGQSGTYTSANSTKYGGVGGGGGAAIPRFFIPAANLGDTFTLTKTPARFVSGGITLTAGDGSGNSGGTASATGISGVTTINGGNGGGTSGTIGQTGSSSSGAGSGGGSGGSAVKSGSSAPSKYSGGAGGAASVIPATGVAPKGATGGTATSSGSNTSGTMAGGSGGGGGGAYPASGTTGGAGFVKVEWVANHFWAARNPGSWSFTPPGWAQAGDLVDVIIIGGGAAGGQGSNGGPGPGGNAAVYTTRTITLGVDLAPTGTLTGQVGAGGSPNGGAGSATTCTTLGMTSAGGSGTSAGQGGKAPAPVTVGGTSYGDGGAGGAGGPSKGALGFGDGTAQAGQPGGVFICVRGG